MDILSKTDDEIYEMAKPIWHNLVISSNLKDYGGFTRDFSTQMLFGANEVELGKQWANNKIITNLKETFVPFGCLRRGVHVTVSIKQTNKEISGEFLGRLVLGEEDIFDKQGKIFFSSSSLLPSITIGTYLTLSVVSPALLYLS